MLLLMAVSLYTSRVILQVLGINDYGIYNLVGGFISIFSFVSIALVNSIQRFFNVAIGKNDNEKYTRIYSMGINIFILFSLLLLIVGGTIGGWFICTQLNIPSGRKTAAIWVFSISLVTSIVMLFRSSDNASIIAFEKMSFYAYISIFEAVFKLAIVFFLAQLNYDKLILYCWLYLAVTVIINIAYKIYVNKCFPVCRYHFIWDKNLLKQLMVFSGWNLLTQGAHIAENQGESFLSNYYYNVSLNAARGVASQVYNAVNLFLTNFQTSFKPQLTKSYAAGEWNANLQLIYRSARFSFFLLSILVVPLSFNLDGLLSIWLVKVPPFTKEFCIFVMLAYLFDSIGAPLTTVIFAQGNIKKLSICSSMLYFIGLLLSFFGLKYTNIPYITAIVCLIIHAIILFFDLYYAHKQCGIKASKFIINIMKPICIVSLILLFVPLGIKLLTDNLWLRLILDVISLCILIFLLGVNNEERTFIINKIRKKASNSPKML